MICSREIKGLATVQYTGYNDCEVLALLRSTCYYCGVHFPDGKLEIVLQLTKDSAKQRALLPIGSVLMENRQGGLSVLSEKEYREKYQACC
jgi:hypothetical protein